MSLLLTVGWQSLIPCRSLSHPERTCWTPGQVVFFVRKGLQLAVFLRRGASQSEPDTRSSLCCPFCYCRRAVTVALCSYILFSVFSLLHCWGLAGDHIQAKILGNAPYGIYKYKFPRAIRTEDNVGAKVFFFKAFLQSSDLSQAELKEDYLWVTKDELGDYLKSEYLKKVSQFLLDL